MPLIGEDVGLWAVPSSSRVLETVPVVLPSLPRGVLCHLMAPKEEPETRTALVNGPERAGGNHIGAVGRTACRWCAGHIAAPAPVLGPSQWCLLGIHPVDHRRCLSNWMVSL